MSSQPESIPRASDTQTVQPTQVTPVRVEPITCTEDMLVGVIRQLTAELPRNDFGLPTGIYRTDLLPLHNYMPAEEEPWLVPDLPGEETLGSSASQTSTDLLVSPHRAALPSPPVEELPFEGGDEAFDAEDPFLLLNGVDPDRDLGEGVGGSGVSREAALAGSVPWDTTTPIGGVGPLVALPRRFTGTGKDPNGDYRIAGFLAGELKNAFVPLQYDEGFPGFEDGRAFWTKLDYEPQDSYQAFQRYLQMAFGRKADPEDGDDYGIAAGGTRAITDLVLQMHPGANDARVGQLVEQYKKYYHLYYWGLRARSYDLYKVAQYRQSQELRAIETQDDHYLLSRKLRARLLQYMDSEEDFWDMMTPKVAIDFLKTTTQLERISAGMPASGPSGEKSEGREGRSFEVAFRTIAQTHNGQRELEENGAGGVDLDEEGNILQRALTDPAATEILQELIIRSGGN